MKQEIKSNGKILILYYHNLGYPMRNTNELMLFCFRKYSNQLCYYVNAAFGIPKYLLDINFDLVIYHVLLLSKRSFPKRFRKFMKNAQILKKVSGIKAAIVQDEFKNTSLLNQFLVEFKIEYIFSAAKESEWKKVYPLIYPEKAKFITVLTGYIDEDLVHTISNLEKRYPERMIDIGYRTTPLRYQLGTQGLLKQKIADVFLRKSSENNLLIDISTDPRDAFLGSDWFKFLLKCKYTLGVESGSSIIDPDGSVQRCVEKLMIMMPKATFNEAKKACFPDKDGNLSLFTIGPRHLEACITKTCQILVEGEYNGILKPWEHYIPVKKDFSNINEIIKIIIKDQLRKAITEKAYQDIVSSDKYLYQNFVRLIIETCLKGKEPKGDITEKDMSIFKINEKREKIIWLWIPIRSFFLNNIIKLLPRKIIYILTRWQD